MSDDSFDPVDSTTDRDTKYRFFPVVRRGYPPSQHYDADEAEGAAEIDASGRLDVSFDVTATGGAPDDTRPGGVAIEMYGPGHVTGLDRRQVVRMEPEPGTSNYPPNYFATVEFDAPDLPWLFTPVADDTYAAPSELPNPDGRGFPWLCLVVVEKTSETEIEPAGTDPLPAMEVPVAELPPLDETWAWAHAQTVGSPKTKEGNSLAEAFGSQSNLTRSRLVSPRNLRANARYVAAVVPTFEAGRRAGLGEPVERPGEENGESGGDGNGTVDGTTRTMALAWDPAKTSAAGGSGSETVRLPLYHHWEFSTGERGDFEFLARELEPVNLSAGAYDIGFSDIDVTDPGVALLDDLWSASRADRTVRVGGALRQADSSADTYVKDEELRQLLNRPADLEEVRDEFDHVVGPPIYGGRHAQVEELPATPPADQRWLSTLNLHPGWRLAAAVGADIVRENQEQLMAAAWEQVGEIRAVNRLLAAAGLSREAMERKLRTLDGASDAWLAGFTGPMHDRVTDGDRSVGATLDESSTPRALTSAPFRRLTGGSGRLAGRLDGDVDAASLLAGVADGSLDVASPRRAPDGMGTATDGTDVRELCRQFGDWTVEDSEPPRREQSVAELQSLLDQLLSNCSRLFELLSTLAAVLREEDLTEGTRTKATDLWDDTYALTDSLRRWMLRVANEETSRDLPTVSDEYTVATAKRLFNAIVEIASRTLLDRREGERLEPEDVRAAQATVFELVAALAEVESYLQGEGGSDLAYLGDLACAPNPGVDRAPAADLGAVADALDPVTGLLDRLESRLGGMGLRDRAADPLDRVMGYPEFPDPMYEDLKAVSEEYLLPGVEEVPRDSFGALETNPQFIEAFMLGLNHEMAAELRWRRFPTDSRGSYFRQFWDPSARVPKPDDEELLKDITEIHGWDDKGPDRRAASPLGSNVMTGATGDESTPPGEGSEPISNVVVVVRGELLRRYPTTTIYATKAKSVPREDGTGTARVPEWPTAEETESEVDDTYHRFPIFRGRLDPDVTFLGFDLTPEEATGETETTTVVDDPDEGTPTDDLGWFFVMEEPPGEVRFGLDVNQGDVGERPNGVTYDTNGSEAVAQTSNPNESPERGWSGLSWGHLVESESDLEATDNVSIRRDRPGEESWRTREGEAWTTDTSVEDATLDAEEVADWGKNSAHMAYITWQRPVRIAIHADDLLPTAGDGNGGPTE